jgi:uncharacterized membrane protein YqjE
MSDDPHSQPPHGLLATLIDVLVEMAQAHVALARAELARVLRRIGAGLVLFALAVALALAALNLLAGAAVSLLIAQGLEPGWAALVVAAMMGLSAAVAALVGLRVLRPAKLVPYRRTNPDSRSRPS